MKEQPENKKKQVKFRYAICKDCREKWNIAKNQDTSPFYLCPRCERRRKHDTKTEKNRKKTQSRKTKKV